MTLTVFSLHWLVYPQRAIEPFVAFPGRDKFSRTQAVSNTLDAIAQTMREVVRGVYFPLVARSVVVGFLGNPVCCDIPHLGVGVFNVLLHAKQSLLRLVLAISHTAELF